jgi:hypothetical protein
LQFPINPDSNRQSEQLTILGRLGSTVKLSRTCCLIVVVVVMVDDERGASQQTRSCFEMNRGGQ